MSADQGAQMFDQIDYIHKNTFFFKWKRVSYLSLIQELKENKDIW